MTVATTENIMDYHPRNRKTEVGKREKKKRTHTRNETDETNQA